MQVNSIEVRIAELEAQLEAEAHRLREIAAGLRGVPAFWAFVRARELEDKFIWSRHEAMVAKIEDWLLNGRERVFVAVGALHLAGPRGLVETLRKRGHLVRQP